MGMFLKYGSHSHAVEEAAISIRRDVLETARNTPYAYREEWDITGFLYADTAAEISTAITTLEAAYATNGKDVTLIMPDGTTESAHKIDSSATNGGVRVTRRPSFPNGTGGEYSTFRTFSITLEAEVPIATADLDTVLREYNEQIQYSGGGPLFGHLLPNVGLPQKQKLKQNTVFKAVQSGSAVGLYAYPPLPPPIWPSALISPIGFPVNKQAPRTVGSGDNKTLMDYGINWSYEFESAYPLVGSPNPWPNI